MSVALKTSPAGAVADTLGDVYRRLADICEVLSVRIAGDAQGGATAAELVKDEAVLDAFVDAEAARIRHRYGTVPRRDVAASRALHDYAWSVALLMSGAWYLERRVPRIRPEDLRLDLATAEFTLTPGADLTCLPGDPAATLPGVLTVPHEDALCDELRAAVAEHMEPLLTAIGPLARRGQRALWGMVADDLVSGIWYLGRTLGREGDAVRAATTLLPTGVTPYPGGAGFRYLTTDDGRRHPTRTRTGCCMYYTIRPDEACATCPRTCDAERLRRLQG
ncbi:(2Fe-2S)-binding protein [Streptomyces dysideae]|uniref:Iron-sulfur protein n=1 Tax=Streptomyces dysideae TaxID=909626 RepID=A0A101UWT9_9ACTN|nr:(2Fe-2S)-binding protein [Streptomyces dysideae]KUO18280.1 iron-sulfur protein [Streptomyces dysideae]